MKRRSVWVTIGVIVAIILLLYWLFMAETLEETVAMVSGSPVCWL